MNIYLGNILFDQVEEMLGYKLTEEDRVIWNKFHCNKADLSEKESCFHVFDIPRCIQFKGEEAKKAILKMFTKDKMVKAMGLIQVYETK
jgi:hypothetical protein